MSNQRLLRIVELMGEGSLSTAEDLIKMELTERADSAKERIKSTLVGSVLENSVSGVVEGLGNVILDSGQGQIRLACADINEAVEKATAFAAFCEGSEASIFKASLNESKTAVVIESDGVACYEMPIEEGHLVTQCQLRSEDLLQFKKNGTLAAL